MFFEAATVIDDMRTVPHRCMTPCTAGVGSRLPIEVDLRSSWQLDQLEIGPNLRRHWEERRRREAHVLLGNSGGLP
jgi:hypothetical protein